MDVAASEKVPNLGKIFVSLCSSPAKLSIPHNFL